MKEYSSADIRNLALVGHAGAGKTMLGEAILAAGGVINRLGSIENGSTVSDFQAAEHERQISIGASLLHTDWQGKKLNIIDTPGHVDFTIEVERSLAVLDGAGCVLDANAGVEPQTGLFFQRSVTSPTATLKHGFDLLEIMRCRWFRLNDESRLEEHAGN